MKVHYSLENFYAKNPVVTIGMFDGVHVGHRTILQKLEQEKNRIDGESVLLTFWPHPQVFFHRTEGFKMLNTLEEKLEVLSQTGLDHCIILPFTKEFSELNPEEYITEILHIGIGAKKVIIGYDHRYGKRGAGDFHLLSSMSITLGFEVEEIPAFDIEHVNISSTKVRNALLEGNVSKAISYLSYPYFISGIVAKGKQIGRTIGFPTANVVPDSEYKLIPALGVYVAEVEHNNNLYKAVVSIGLNPTISPENSNPTIEAYVLDFSGDLYKEKLKIFFLERIRSEKKFANLQELKDAISQDIQYSRIFFENRIN